MSKDTILTEAIRGEIALSLDEIIRQGAQKMLKAALEAEVASYLQKHHHARDD